MVLLLAWLTLLFDIGAALGDGGFLLVDGVEECRLCGGGFFLFLATCPRPAPGCRINWATLAVHSGILFASVKI